MIFERFLSAATNEPDKILFRWLEDNGIESKQISTSKLLHHAYGIADHLRGVAKRKPGDRVLLCYLPSLDVVPALLGCMLAGVIPVPIPPPNLQNLDHDLVTLNNFVTSCGASTILTHSEYHKAKRISSVLNFFKGHSWPDIPWITTDSIPNVTVFPKELTQPKSTDVAFLQYTSGSTSFPKGVMITFENLTHQFRRYEEELMFGSNSVSVAWVPYYHDHCLIAGILNAIWGNGSLVLMSPMSFLKRPSLWMESVSRYKATHTAGPNFGYELLLKKVTSEEIKNLDLSHLVVVQNAAEPVRFQTMEKLKTTFQGCGLNPEALQASYGLAEHTVGVTLNGKKVIHVVKSSLEKGSIKISSEGTITMVTVLRLDANDSLSLYSCGTASYDVAVRVVNPKTRIEVPELAVGEIWVDSPSKTFGYYGLEQESENTFGAELEEADGRKYLRTGDLGFMYQGELFVTGRVKDLIIIRGRNLYPHDIEDSVRVCDASIRPGGVAAFSVEVENEEQLVVVVEVKEMKKIQPLSVAKAVFQAVTTHHNVLCSGVVVGEPGTVVKTTSGKVKRKSTRDVYLKGLTPKAFTLQHIGEYSLKPPVALSPKRELNSSFVPQDPDYRRTLKALTTYFGHKSSTCKRVFHNTAITATGMIKIPAKTGLPDNTLFVPGTQYPVMVRVSNGVQEDDACIDNRGATIRILHPDFSEEYSHSLMDLLLVTGPCFMVNSAQSLLEWSQGSQAQLKMASDNPHWASSLWNTLKEPLGYNSYFYYSKVAYQFGPDSFVRFRLIPASREDKGGVTPSSVLPPDTFSRHPNENRPKNFMKEKFSKDVLGGGMTFYLQAQSCSLNDGLTRDEILDATKEWPERFQWKDIAEITLTKILQNDSVEKLAFSPHNTHPDFQIPVAVTPTEPASLGHARALTYWIASAVRTGQTLPPELQEWAGPHGTPKPQTKPLRVAVVGGGVSGLTAAYELYKRGHQVTVFEKSDHVAGKSYSVEVGGKKYDLGAHFCSDVCESVKEFTTEFGLELEPTTPVFTYDVETRKTVSPQIDPSKYKLESQKFAELKQKYFPDMSSPVMYTYGKILSEPAKDWFEKHNLESIRTLISESYTSSGYGHYEDANLAALYVVKFLSMGVLETAIPNFWTIKGGMESLWSAVTAKLPDVRMQVTDLKIKRSIGEISVTSQGKTEKFDKLLIATPLHKSLDFLDATVEEADLFSRILYYPYWTVVAKLHNVPGMGLYMLKQNCNDLPSSKTSGHCVAFHNRYTEGNIFTCYSYATPTMTKEDIIKYLQQNIEKIGGKIDEIYGTYKWDYFPHFQPSDLQAGVYERLDKLQGQQNTFYTGSIFNFELVECNVGHTQALIRRMHGESPKKSLKSVQPAKTELQNIKNEKEDAKKLSKKQLFDHIKKQISSVLQVPESGLIEATQFNELGIDSLRAMQITEALASSLGLKLTASVLFENPRLSGFVEFIRKEIHKGEPKDEISQVQHTENVVYGEEHGVGLLMDIFVPEDTPNGFAVLDVASSKFKSPKSAITHRQLKGIYSGFCSKGFTVFAVRPGNAGNVTVGDMRDHIRLAVRWIVNHSSEYSVDPYNIGLFGLSAGGHLALLTALTSSVESCFVGGLAAFAPPTNLLCSTTEELEALFCQRRSQELPEEVIRAHSPLFLADSLPPQQRLPPVLLFHAEQDPEISYECSQQLVEKLKARGTSAELILRDSDQHEWPEIHKDADTVAKWMLECLQNRNNRGSQNSAATETSSSVLVSWPTSFIRRNRGHYGIGGTWAVYDLAQVAQTLEDGKVAFPEAVTALEEYAINGSYPRSLDPKCNLLMVISIAVGLENLRSKVRSTVTELTNQGFTSEEAVDSAMAHVIIELDRSKVQHPHRHVRLAVLFHGFLSKIVSVFLTTPLVSRLTHKQHRYMESLVFAAQMPSQEVLQRMLAHENTPFCEYLSEHQLQLDSVKQYVHFMWPATTPGQTSAFLSKYYMATKDEFALNILKELVKHPKTGTVDILEDCLRLGLAPHITLPVITFALYFLSTSNFPIREFMAEEISLFESGTKDGMGLFGYQGTHPEIDADVTALVNIVRTKLGLPLAIPSSHFDQGGMIQKSAM